MSPLVLFVAYNNLAQAVLAFGFCALLRMLLLLLRHEQKEPKRGFFKMLLLLLGPQEEVQH